MLKPSSVLSFFFLQKEEFCTFTFRLLVNCPVLFGAGVMAGLTQKELGNFLQDEIFDPHLLASCGVNLDRGGGQLGSNMSSSTATGKFEIV